MGMNIRLSRTQYAHVHSHTQNNNILDHSVNKLKYIKSCKVQPTLDDSRKIRGMDNHKNDKCRKA